MKKLNLLLMSVGAAALLAGATFAAWAVTDKADPIGVKVTPGTIEDDDTKYVTMKWGEATSLENVQQIKVAENRKVGIIELLTDGHEYTGNLTVSITSETTGKQEGEAYLKDYLSVAVYNGKKDLEKKPGAEETDPATELPTTDDRLLTLEAQYKEEAASRVYTASHEAIGGKYAIPETEKFEGKYYTVFVTLDEGSAPVYEQIKSDVVFLKVDWSPKSGEEVTSNKVYVTRPAAWTGEDTYAYAWTGSKQNAAWPGVKMNQFVGEIYSLDIPVEFENLIFNDGGQGEGHETKTISMSEYTPEKPWYDIANDKWEKVPEETEVTYKLAGKIMGVEKWSFDKALDLEKTSCETAVEYVAKNLELKAGDALKGIDSDGKYYPNGGDDYAITKDGVYNVYFRPKGNTEWGYTYLYVETLAFLQKQPAGQGDWTKTAMTYEAAADPEPEQYVIENLDLAENDVFVISLPNGAWLHFDAIEDGEGSAKANFEDAGEPDHNIKVKTAGKYNIYAKPGDNSIWISEVKA